MPAFAPVLTAPPILAHVAGYVGVKPEGVKAQARWVIAVGERHVTLHVTELRPIAIDIAYWTILNALEPLPITFTLYGDAAVVERFSGAPAGAKLSMLGALHMGPGPVTFLLDSIGVTAPPDVDDTPRRQ